MIIPLIRNVRSHIIEQMFLYGGDTVKERILKSIHNGQIIKIIYISEQGKVTQRRIKVIKLNGSTFQAYCFLRNTKRTFKIDNVLALLPVTYNERTVM